jgi:hypothetical protein
MGPCTTNDNQLYILFYFIFKIIIIIILMFSYGFH